MPLLLMLPPQEPKTREWAARVKGAVPSLEVVVAEDEAAARAAIGRADCAFGTLPADWLPHATRLRWLQAPQAAPPRAARRGRAARPRGARRAAAARRFRHPHGAPHAGDGRIHEPRAL